jgi:hypothetical protein
VTGSTSRFEPRITQRVTAAILTAALHVGLLLALIMFGGRDDGRDTGTSPTMKLVLLEATDVDRTEGVELPPVPTSVPTPEVEEQLQTAASAPEQIPEDEVPAQPEQGERAPADQPVPPTAPLLTVSIEPELEPTQPATSEIPDTEKATLSKYLARSAEEAGDSPRTHLKWEEDGRKYSAVLIRERAKDGTSLERIVAEVSTSDRGRLVTTRVNLKRLAFSQFTQVVDHWDPMVQLHEDEIVGRFHTNTRFNLAYDSKTAPKFLGKVTTAARSFSADAKGRRRDADIFQGGLETRAGRIGLPNELQPFEWAPRDQNARIHEFRGDARIRFFKDGSYTWRMPDSPTTGYVNEPTGQPVYFIATRGVTLYVEGTVHGKVLVYSPERIVIEGSLKYANHPREQPDSADFLGLVCDKYVEVAGQSVTGPGDLEIDAAIFARRRFVVTDIERPRTSTLKIYGSLAAGTLSATEPRYATRIDYDKRFESVRPPGFPHTNRYEVGEWDAQWTEVPETSAADL